MLCWLATAAPAAAQVLEVREDGSVVTYDGPTLFLSEVPDAPALAGARARGRSGDRAGRAIAGAIRVVRYAPPAATGAHSAAAPAATLAQAIHTASLRHQVSERLVEAVAWRESGFNASAVSRKGALGVMQLMPQTARFLGVDAEDPNSNIDGGADYLARMMRRFNGDTAKALAAYNAGPEAVERYQGVPPYAETIAYVDAIMRRLGQTGSSVVFQAARTGADGF